MHVSINYTFNAWCVYKSSLSLAINTPDKSPSGLALFGLSELPVRPDAMKNLSTTLDVARMSKDTRLPPPVIIVCVPEQENLGTEVVDTLRTPQFTQSYYSRNHFTYTIYMALCWTCQDKKSIKNYVNICDHCDHSQRLLDCTQILDFACNIPEYTSTRVHTLLIIRLNTETKTKCNIICSNYI